MRMRIIAGHHHILRRIAEHVRRAARQLQFRERLGIALQLLCHQMPVVGIDVAVGAHPDDLAGRQVALLRQHPQQQRRLEDVEGKAQAEIARALVEDAGQFSVGDEILVGHVARRQRHAVELGDVPAGEDVPP